MTYLLYAPFVGGGLVAGWVIYSGITKGLAFMARAFGTGLLPPVEPRSASRSLRDCDPSRGEVL